jgi:hypothetical protein
MLIIKQLGYTHLFIIALYGLGNVFRDQRLLESFTIHNPTFASAYHLCYVVLPTLDTKNIAKMFFMEMSIYYAIMQTIILHMLQWLYSPELAWLTALYFAVYFLDYTSSLKKVIPACKVPSSGSFVFIYCILLLSAQQNGPALAFGDQTHFQALVISDTLHWIHSLLWKRQSQKFMCRQKQMYMMM